MAKHHPEPEINLPQPKYKEVCLNIEGEDPITLEEIKKLNIKNLVLLPSGNCMTRNHVKNLTTDPLSRQPLTELKETEKTRRNDKEKEMEEQLKRRGGHYLKKKNTRRSKKVGRIRHSSKKRKKRKQKTIKRRSKQ